MKLYFSPLACSLASRIALTEAGADAEYVMVDGATLPDGGDYRAINPLALVPLLELDDGRTLTENAAVLEEIADQFPEAALAPTDPVGRSELRRWLSFIGTELHNGIFSAQFDPKANDGAKRYALEKGASRLRHLDAHLAGREHVLDAFSVVDMYLFVVLNWTLATPVELADYPNLAAFRQRMLERPSVASSFQLEVPLYQAKRQRNEKR